MSDLYNREIEEWAEAFRAFEQVEKVICYSSRECLTVKLRVPDDSNPAKEEIVEKGISRENLDDELYKFNANTREVASYFLRQWGVLSYEKETLLAYFDVLGYSSFIEKYSISECIHKIEGLMSSIRNSAKTDIGTVKIKHWILSDSIIIVLDTIRHPLYKGSIEILFGTCSLLLSRALRAGFPLRGAIGGGSFYKDGEIIVSTALVDAVNYEKMQDWLGAVITPKAVEILKKCDDNFENVYTTYAKLERGRIPWKPDSNIDKDKDYFYIKPSMNRSDWEKHLPEYFKSADKIKNSQILYG